MLKHWQPLTSIVFLIETISSRIFRSNYLRNNTRFSQFFCAFWKSRINVQHFQKRKRQHLYRIYWPLWTEVRLKKSLWVICKLLRLFLNPLTADNKYYVLDRDNLKQYFQMQLSQNQNIFSQYFFWSF